MSPSNLISLVSDSGKGRAFIVLHERGRYAVIAKSIAQTLAQSSRTILLESCVLTDENWSEVTDELIHQLTALSVRQASFVGFGASCSTVQHYALIDLKLVRSMALIDGATRAHPSRATLALDWLESHLPLGLPARASSKGFDAKPFLHSLRCPVLVVSSRAGDAHSRAEAQVLSARLPTAWYADISPEPNEAAALSNLVQNFQQFPAKCPQRAA